MLSDVEQFVCCLNDKIKIFFPHRFLTHFCVRQKNTQSKIEKGITDIKFYLQVKYRLKMYFPYEQLPSLLF